MPCDRGSPSWETTRSCRHRREGRDDRRVGPVGREALERRSVRHDDPAVRRQPGEGRRRSQGTGEDGGADDRQEDEQDQRPPRRGRAGPRSGPGSESRYPRGATFRGSTTTGAVASPPCAPGPRRGGRARGARRPRRATRRGSVRTCRSRSCRTTLHGSLAEARIGVERGAHQPEGAVQARLGGPEGDSEASPRRSASGRSR